MLASVAVALVAFAILVTVAVWYVKRHIVLPADPADAAAVVLERWDSQQVRQFIMALVQGLD